MNVYKTKTQVVWISERKNVLGTFFWWLTIWAYIKYSGNPTKKAYIILILFGLGLMSKPILVSLPFVLILLDYWPLKRFKFEQNKTKSISKWSVVSPFFLEKIPFFALATMFCIVTLIAQKSGGAIASLHLFPFHMRIANALISYSEYIVKTLWPINLTVFYPYPDIISAWKTVAAFFIIVFSSFLAIRVMEKKPYIFLGWFWYLGTLVPVIGLVQVGSQAMADRYA